MSSVGLFVAGFAVTVVVTASMSLLVWGAILDGRDEAERRRREASEKRKEHGMSGQDIVETARAAGSFTTLVDAVEAAGLADTLRGAGPFTVFAPTDDAFAKLAPEALEALVADPPRLTEVLTYHVVPGRLTATAAAQLTSAPTVHGDPLPIRSDGGEVRVGPARVVQADVEAANGVIHAVDDVLIPAA